MINFFLLSSKCPKGVSLAQWLWPSNNGWNKVDVLKRLSQISDIKKGIKIGRQRTALKDFVNLWTYLLHLCKMKKLFCLLYFLLIFMLILYWKSRYSVTLQQALFKWFPTHVWQNAHVNIVRRAMVCDFPFSKFYSFIKGIMHIYIVFLKNLRQMLWCFTY